MNDRSENEDAVEGSRDPDPGSSPARPDRLPLIVLSAVLLVGALAAGGTAYLLRDVHLSIPTRGVAAPASTATEGPVSHKPRLVRYAGLTSDEAVRLAASDLTKLTSGSLPEGSTVATGNSHTVRTRCFHAGRSRAFWEVTLDHGTPIFESKRLGLIVCNHDPHVVVLGATLEH